MTKETSSPTVLIAEDDHSLMELYKTWLEQKYTVKTARNGEEALAVINQSVDVILIDRQIPKLSGDDVSHAIRDQGYSCRVAMITAVEPDFDILDLGCDEYLTKPVSKEVLCEIVARLVHRGAYDEQLQKYFALISKKAVLETQKTAAELTDSQEYQDLRKEINTLKEQLDATLAEFTDDDYADLFRTLDTSPLTSIRD